MSTGCIVTPCLAPLLSGVQAHLKGHARVRQHAVSFFVLRNSARAKRRGWITSSVAAVDLSIQSSQRPIFTWRPLPEELRDEEARRQEEHRLAEVARAEAEGHQAVTLGWGDPDDPDEDDGKTIEHEADPEPSNKDKD